MPAVKFLTITQQVAKHLREEISRGALSGTMPGRTQLAADMGVNHKTVDAALHLLKDAGLIVSQGAGRSHKIIPPADAPAAPSLRIGLILWAPSDRLWGAMLDLQHRLSNAGHRIVKPECALYRRIEKRYPTRKRIKRP
jgi:DNA-binding transcriptional MocR family regulator